MNSLQQKLNQLSLTSMSHQLDQAITDAAARNLSLAQALESLVDLELESRNSRSIERRFRLSRLHARHSVDSFHLTRSVAVLPGLSADKSGCLLRLWSTP
jgi:DNA replication protein DnaC